MERVSCGLRHAEWAAIIDLNTQMVLLYNPRALAGCDDTRHGRVFFCGWLAKRSAAIDLGHGAQSRPRRRHRGSSAVRRELDVIPP
jgi:hypothetical protein